MRKNTLALMIILGICLISSSAYCQDNYSIRVYLKDQIVKVFRDGRLLKEIACSTGIKPGSTPEGKYKTYFRKEEDTWVEEDGTKIRYFYITRFNKYISFHSLIEGNHPLVEKGNQLFKARKPSSMGCVRLRKEDAKWIYSLPLRTPVEVVGSSGTGAVQK